MRVEATPRRFVIGAIAGALVLAACGGGSSDGSDDAAASGATADEQLPEEVPDDESDAAPAAPVAPAAGQVDLVGTEVVPASDVETNLLPDVVLDDVSRGMKVNFRNLVPQEKPILLWAYAPH